LRRQSSKESGKTPEREEMMPLVTMSPNTIFEDDPFQLTQSGQKSAGLVIQSPDMDLNQRSAVRTRIEDCIGNTTIKD
jgi:hypothetical protein